MKNLGFLGYNHYCATYDGRIYSLYSNKFLHPNVQKKTGYAMVTLCEGGKKFQVLVHRVIAMTFVDNDNPSVKTQVNHLDGNKLNNAAWNLEWTTPEENTHHAHEMGLKKDYVNKYRSLDDATALEICRLLEQGARVKDICEMFGVNQPLVSGIKNGSVYPDISKEFNFRKVPTSNRISEHKIIGICEDLSGRALCVNKIAKKWGVSFSVVKGIKDRKTYTYISNNYDW
ncbi:HNH endonuclease [Escherichia coli]|uniref:HNH endonuclease n=1 Tax=Escherichia coli TaxID=562 RepID=UPI0018E5403C|nr:HNH endonuclease [Escherichia coli]